jgi:hypothetical protein
VIGGALFPISPEQMIETIGAFEAVINSVEMGRPAELASEIDAARERVG